MPPIQRSENKAYSEGLQASRIDARDRSVLGGYMAEFNATTLRRCDGGQAANRVYMLGSIGTQTSYVIKIPQYELDPDASTLSVAAREAQALRILARHSMEPIITPS